MRRVGMVQCVRDCSENPTAKNERGVATKSPPKGNAQKAIAKEQQKKK